MQVSYQRAGISIWSAYLHHGYPGSERIMTTRNPFLFLYSVVSLITQKLLLGSLSMHDSSPGSTLGYL